MEPIRILQVIGQMNRGGAESMIMNLYRAIDKNRVQFDFVEHFPSRTAYDDEIEKNEGVIYRCPQFTPKTVIRYIKWWNDFFSSKGRQYHIIHGHIGSSAAIYLRIAKKHGLYTIAHSHSAGYENNLHGFFYRVLSFPTRYIADHYFACSKEAGISRYGKKVGNDIQRCQVINNAINSKLFVYNQAIRDAYRAELGLEKHKIVIGHVGRFIPVKNHAFLLDLICELRKVIPDISLLLIGDGPLKPEIEEKSKDAGVDDITIFSGVRSDVAQLMQAMDFFVFPSLFEGLPVSLIEAQAAGLKCLCSDCITLDADVTGNCSFLPLDNLEVWVETVKKELLYEREDYSRVIEDAGYDVSRTAFMMTDFYEKAYKRISENHR